jgi:hypothetical protein
MSPTQHRHRNARCPAAEWAMKPEKVKIIPRIFHDESYRHLLFTRCPNDLHGGSWAFATWANGIFAVRHRSPVFMIVCSGGSQGGSQIAFPPSL